jgi:predicted ATPase/DNA-binding SARP family transcriptional activator
MSQLIISLLGPPRILLDDTSLTARAHKVTALLIYLAITPGRHTRENLVTLLWPELNSKHAYGALRTTLWRLRQAGLDQWLEIQRDTITFTPPRGFSLDVTTFQELLSKCNTHEHPLTQVCSNCLPLLTEAITLYRGDFLEGFSLRDSPEFDNWQSLLKDNLHVEATSVLEKLVRYYRSNGDVERAIYYARRWLSLDRYNENAHRQMMFLYATTGQRSAALTQFRNCRRLLKESRLEPQEETYALYQQILSGRGTLTSSLELPIFLLTDIENITALGATSRDDATKTILEYNRILKECAQRYRGKLIQPMGKYAVIFFDKGQPLHCALRINKQVANTDWSTPEAPRVRIALNAADVQQSSLKGYEADILRTARLLSTGWGGQILLTAQILNILDRPEGTEIADLGTHILEDLGEPLHIYTLQHPGFQVQEVPPLKSLSSHRHNLPTYPTLFIGREKEQREIANLLAESNCRLLTLTGPGGIGKTRLALQVAAQQIERFPDGVFFVPLVTPKTPEMIPSVLAEVFKLNYYGQDNPAQIVQDYLRQKSMLLIMDNFEHLIQGVEVLSNLLAIAPEVKMLVTSRERLILHEEWVYELQGMAVPPPTEIYGDDIESYSAVQLFLHNARRIHPGFQTTQTERACISRICQLVDGLPLALELASSWVRTFTCREIAHEIERSLDFLQTSMLDIPPRHRSLGAVFEHSWNLLSEEGRRTFRRLCLFRGGFTAEAAQHVANASTLTLAGFVDRSMLRRSTHGRYEIIESLRHYALNKLRESPEDYLATGNLHCDYYADFLNQKYLGDLMSDKQSQALDEIRSEIENIRKAWDWAIDHERWEAIQKSMYALVVFNEILGHFAEGREIFQKARLKLQECISPELELLLAYTLMGEAWMAFWTGDHPEGVQGLENSLARFQKLNARPEAGIALYWLARCHQRLGDLTLAKEQAQESLENVRNDPLAMSSPVQALIARILTTLGSILFNLGEFNEARRVLQESLDIHRQVGTQQGTSHVLDALAKVAISQGQIDEAKGMWEEALEIATKLGALHTMAILQNNLSSAYDTLGNGEKTIHHVRKAIELSQEVGDRHITAICLNNLAYDHIKYKLDYAEAYHLYQESIAIFKDIKDLKGITYSTYDLSQAYLQAGENNRAKDSCITALRAANLLNSQPLILYTLSGLAHVLAAYGELEPAFEICTLILKHPEIDLKTQERARQLEAKIETQLSSTLIESIRQRCQSVELPQIVTKYI